MITRLVIVQQKLAIPDPFLVRVCEETQESVFEPSQQHDPRCSNPPGRIILEARESFDRLPVGI